VQNYIKHYVLLDIMASIPFDYLLSMVDESNIAIRYFRLLRLLKVYRVTEILALVQQYTSINVPVFRLTFLAGVMVVTAHWFNCILILFAKWELGKSTRFDGNSLLKYLVNSSATYLPPVENWSPWNYYFNLYLLSISFMGSIMYGDIIPFTLSEETLSILYMIIGRVFVAFLFAEASSFVQNQQTGFDDLMRSESIAVKWTEIHALNEDIRERVIRYF